MSIVEDAKVFYRSTDKQSSVTSATVQSQVEDRHAEDKAAGKFAQNLDRLPVLKVGDAVIGQSKAIERYLATEFNLMGSDAMQAAQVSQP